ncbi:hypothetical protein Ppa06_64500 [Planomonospora parontospora subsp. parontospora]|uniref:Uncharacterized protein n=2 Tax=Planomonospora parontospora TaxID=58119 RepID=A0AA37BNM9_9ACTN|nr:hypothetical protein [Planomonospora parontospora]GGK94200.1 hypothetical protein GCM10010126_61960 [Planomonospora parontospora]GII12652.1 hypothetical protein Ppa06_64500 [Planomonospora parontospora subsp. parontospora]
MANKSRRSMADFLAQQRVVDQSADTGPAESSPAAPVEPSPSAITIPDPYTGGDEAALTERERADLVACEAAVDVLRVAFAQAGKALQVIRDARLYRESHPTFEAYVEDRWQMKTSQAYRLIQAWPLAEVLSPIGDKIINESQVRELIPLAEHHGREAAVTVYRTVAETDGVRVTAAVLKGVVGVLPPDRFDPEEAVQQIRAYLTRNVDGQDVAEAAGGSAPTFTAEVGRLRTILKRVVKRDLISRAAAEDPEEVKRVVSELRALLDEVEQKVL